jgi:hypothetical protein
MADKVPTFEEIEKHLESFNLADFQPGGKHHVTAAGGTAAAIPNVCPAYKMVKPILLAVLAFPLIPKKIKDAIKAFMAVLDVICP